MICPNRFGRVFGAYSSTQIRSRDVISACSDWLCQGSEYPWVTPGTFVGDYVDYKTKPLVDSALHFEATHDEDMFSKM